MVEKLISNLLNELVKKFNGNKSIAEVMVMLETVEELMYGETDGDETNVSVIYNTFESDKEKEEALHIIDNYMKKIFEEGSLEDFEETHFIDTIRGLTLTYENEDNIFGQMKLMKKLTNEKLTNLFG